jgi:hypothetical protein
MKYEYLTITGTTKLTAILIYEGSRGSSGSIVPDYGLDKRGSIPGGGRGYFL